MIAKILILRGIIAADNELKFYKGDDGSLMSVKSSRARIRIRQSINVIILTILFTIICNIAYAQDNWLKLRWYQSGILTERDIPSDYIVEPVAISIKDHLNFKQLRKDTIPLELELEKHGVMPDLDSLKLVDDLNPWLSRDYNVTVEGDVLIIPNVSGSTFIESFLGKGYKVEINSQSYRQIVLNELTEYILKLNVIRDQLIQQPNTSEEVTKYKDQCLNDVRTQFVWASRAKIAVDHFNFVEMGLTFRLNFKLTWCCSCKALK
jgi:hypothetical protein